MNVHPGAVFNTVIHDIREAIPYITAYISFEPEKVHLQLEEIRQEIQDATSYYLINIPTPKTIFWTLLMKQSITLWNSYRLANTIMDLWPPQPIRFILQPPSHPFSTPTENLT